MPALKKKGHRNQSELFRWVNTVLADNGKHENLDAGDPLLDRQAKARRELKAACKNGWVIGVTEEGSPADQAGIDFVWLHRHHGWYAIDVTALQKSGVPELIHVAIIRNASAKGECGQTKIEDRIAFAELLVCLSKQSPILCLVEAKPPSASRKSNNLEELIAFQKRLKRLSKGAHGRKFQQWATRLAKPIGFLKGNKRRLSGDVAIDDLKSIVAAIDCEEIKCIFSGTSRACHDPEFVNRGFVGSLGISYEPTEDLLLVPDSNSPRLFGVSKAVENLFERCYKLRIGDGLSESLIATKRHFYTCGMDFIIHAILDEVESKVRLA